MTSKEITDRKLYLSSLRSQLSLEDNQSIVTEMTSRSKQIEAITKALISANINRDNVSGINIYTNIDKSDIVKLYLNDLFFWDAIKLKTNGTDNVLIAKGNLFKYAKSIEAYSKDDETINDFKIELSKVLDHITSCFDYYQIDNIKIIEDRNTPESKIWVKLLPSDNYLEYLQKIKFISHNRFFK